MKNSVWKNKNSGVTLVELLVAMVVGIVLLGGVYVSFVSSTTTNSMNEQLSRMQENGRFVINYLNEQVRMAGYLGCLQDVSQFTNTLNGGTDFLWDFGEGIYGLEGLSNGTWIDNVGVVDPTSTGTGTNDFTVMKLNSPVPLPTSDIVVVRGVEPGAIFFDNKPADPSADFKIEGPVDQLNTISEFDVLMVTDCTHASVFQVTNYSVNSGNLSGNVIHNTGVGSPGNDTKNLGNTYSEGAEIVKPSTVIYYIASNVAGQPALYRKIGTNNVEELIEGVENMQIRYGEDTSGNRAADIYVDAGSVTDWANVVSARIGLLVRSPNDLLRGDIDTATYDVNGTDIDAPGDDRRLRMVMSTTIGIRNRLR